MAVKNYHRMSNAERTKMIFFMRDHLTEFVGKTREEVAKICMEGLGSHVNSQHIKTGREYLENAGVELWEESKNKFRKSTRRWMDVLEEIEQSTRDIINLKNQIKLIMKYLPLNQREKFESKESEYKSFCNAHLAETPSMDEWRDNLIEAATEDKNKEN